MCVCVCVGSTQGQIQNPPLNHILKPLFFKKCSQKLAQADGKLVLILPCKYLVDTRYVPPHPTSQEFGHLLQYNTKYFNENRDVKDVKPNTDFINNGLIWSKQISSGTQIPGTSNLYHNVITSPSKMSIRLKLSCAILAFFRQPYHIF